MARKLVSPDAERLAEAIPKMSAPALRSARRAPRSVRFFVNRTPSLCNNSTALAGSERLILRVNPDDAETGYWRSFNQVGFAWVLHSSAIVPKH